MSRRYRCSNCNESFNLKPGSKVCPLCGNASLISQIEQTTQEKLKELEQMLPILHEKYKDFAEYYCKFKITNETLRTYATRGIIKRDQIPDFRPENLTDLFYKSRKKRKI